MSSCKHGFVVRSIFGTNRFLCRECNTRFLRYPQRPDRWAIVREALKIYESNFVKRINTPAIPNQVTYTFSLTDKATFTYQFVEDGNGKSTK